MKDIPSSFQHINVYVNKKVKEHKEIRVIIIISMIYLFLYSINMNKHQQYSYYIGTFGLSKDEGAKMMREWLQYSVNSTVLLFIYL
jgi:hypothetical protein